MVHIVDPGIRLLTKTQDIARTPTKIFQDPFKSHECLNYEENNGIHLQYSECSPLQKMQHEAECVQKSDELIYSESVALLVARRTNNQPTIGRLRVRGILQ